MYALLFLMSASSTYIYLLALERNRVYLWASYVVIVAASMYVHLLAVLVLPLHFVFFLVTWSRHRAAWKGWLVSFLILTLPYLPLVRWELALLLRPFTTGHQFYRLHEILTILLFSFSLNAAPHQNLLAIALYVFLLLAGLLLHVRDGEPGAISSVRRWLVHHRESIILGLYAVVPVVVLYLISLGMPIFTDRYLITVVPAFLLLLAAGVVSVSKRSTGLAAACLGLVLVSNLYVVAYQGSTKIKSDFRSVAELVRVDGRGDLVLFLIPNGRPVFEYYYGDELAWADAPYTNRGLGPRGVGSALEEATSGSREVWLVVTEEELWDDRGLVNQWFEANGTLLRQTHVARVDAYLYSFSACVAMVREEHC
jgi:hypothetical protein